MQLTVTEKVVSAFTAVFLSAVFAATAKIMLQRKRFKKEKALFIFRAPRVFTVFYTVISLIAAAAAVYTLKGTLTSLCMAICLVAASEFCISLQFSCCGITERALYCNGRRVEWFYVYDYYIDKQRRTVVFSGNIKGGLTLKGLMSPLKYKAKEEEELEKYLDSHRGKFFNKIVIR